VIWDTSLSKETTGGILTMFGHEMGHYALNHIWKGLAFMSAMVFVLLYLGYRTIGWLLARMEIRGACARLTIGPLFRLCCCSSRSSVSRQMLSAYVQPLSGNQATFTVSK